MRHNRAKGLTIVVVVVFVAVKPAPWSVRRVALDPQRPKYLSLLPCPELRQHAKHQSPMLEIYNGSLVHVQSRVAA